MAGTAHSSMPMLVLKLVVFALEQYRGGEIRSLELINERG
jgi:hypothetical protein